MPSSRGLRQARLRQPQDQGRLVDRRRSRSIHLSGLPQRQASTPTRKIILFMLLHLHLRGVGAAAGLCRPHLIQDQGRRSYGRGGRSTLAVAAHRGHRENGVIGADRTHAVAPCRPTCGASSADTGQAGGDGAAHVRLDRQAARRPRQHRRLAPARITAPRASQSPLDMDAALENSQEASATRPAWTRSSSSAAARSTRRAMAPADRLHITHVAASPDGRHTSFRRSIPPIWTVKSGGARPVRGKVGTAPPAVCRHRRRDRVASR